MKIYKISSILIFKSEIDYSKYLTSTPETYGSEYYRLDIPKGVSPPAKGTKLMLNGKSVITLTPQSPSDIAAGKGGPVAKSMEDNDIVYLVNCLPEGHKWL